jgi:hypothetical protein
MISAVSEGDAQAAAKNSSLRDARKAKNDEFYTQWVDIEREVNAYLEYDEDVFRGKTILLPCDDPEWSNFTKYFALHFMDLGLKKLISTSYAPESNLGGAYYAPTLFETANPSYDASASKSRGRRLTLTYEDASGDGQIDIDDLQWEYLDGDGDFQSDEVMSLRDEADFVITNPPFSLFKPFIAWLIEGGKQFSVIGSKHASTYTEIFPLIRDNKMWIGRGFAKGDAYFRIPEAARTSYADGVYDPVTQLVHFRNVSWYTNIEHGRRHEPMQLMTADDNKKFSKYRVVREAGYQRYVNFDAIEVPYLSAIPSDCDGIMGVPITFLDQYNPEQFEILANMDDHAEMRKAGAEPISKDFMEGYRAVGGTGAQRAGGYWVGLADPNRFPFKRIFIRHRNAESG